MKSNHKFRKEMNMDFHNLVWLLLLDSIYYFEDLSVNSSFTIDCARLVL